MVGALGTANHACMTEQNPLSSTDWLTVFLERLS